MVKFINKYSKLSCFIFFFFLLSQPLIYIVFAPYRFCGYYQFYIVAHKTK